MTRPAAPDKQGITKPVEISDHGLHRLISHQRDAMPLGAAADSAADVQLGIQPATAG